ncbi:glycosyltransferase family 2 protein [Rubellicoccus peritrichatus]|uniref:Glycosyltransferase n=1 Tax=Rubellicoccus peritrichatus TaxID=3080537 RepID=A0AAQ3L9W4_9BACT|nr:glycosyltransferase [Puniceicoccus sp. CR14]WOO42005.1 glycosyltransferase [Puniceicoccus sp. CR14]
MKRPTAISVVMRSKDEAWALEGTLASLFKQNFNGEIELIVIDSGSTDGSVEIIESYNPQRFVQIQPHEYVPGIVLNRGMREASHDYVVFLNADATPANDCWLVELLDVALGTPNWGTVFSRQIPRDDCQAVFAHDYDRCFGPNRESVNWDHFFSMVSCVVNRSVWEAQPFREDLQYAEDDEWSRRLKASGYAVAFAPKSVAIHSHNYTIKQAYKRAFGDSKAMAATSTVEPRAVNLHYTVALGTVRDFQRDLKWCKQQRKLTEAPHCFVVRLAQRLGKWKGFHAGWTHYHGAKVDV